MYEVFMQLLQAKGVTVADVCRATKISQANMSGWKSRYEKDKTAMLRPDAIQRLADYFGVTVEYLTTGVETAKNDQYYLNEETMAVAQDYSTNKKLKMLFDAARFAEPEDLDTVYAMLMALKKKENHED